MTGAGGEHWTESFPSRFLGAADGTHYFLSQFGNLESFSARAMTSLNLQLLAGREWYATHFPRSPRSSGTPQWGLARDVIIAHSRSLEPFRPDSVRGRGIWRTGEDELLVHLGDRVLAPGAKRYDGDLRAYCRRGSEVYVRGVRIEGPDPQETLSVEHAREIMALFQDLLWEFDGRRLRDVSDLPLDIAV